VNDPLIHRVMDVVANVLGTDPSDLHAASSPDTVEAWDSFAQLNIMVALEDEFGVVLDPEDSPSMLTVASIVDVVRSRLPQ
jgi:acyl carrier protein